MTVPTHHYRMHTTPRLDYVELTVADLDRSLQYYTELIGMQVLRRESGTADVGVPGRPLVVLHEIGGAPPAPASSPGLSHVAPRVPERADLALFVEHYAASGLPIDLRDHIVSESGYVSDPDGHTIEVTWDRPSDEWSLEDGMLPVVARPLAPEDLTGGGQPFGQLPAGTSLGHVQLKVNDAGLVETEPFYRDVLGFDVLGRLKDSFRAFGVDGRSLLVVTNRFNDGGAAPAPEHSAHLLGVHLTLSDPSMLQTLVDQLASAGYVHQLAGSRLTLRDPSGNELRFTGPSGSTAAE